MFIILYKYFMTRCCPGIPIHHGCVCMLVNIRVMIKTIILLITKTCMFLRILYKQNNHIPHLIQLFLTYLFTRGLSELLEAACTQLCPFFTIKIRNINLNIWGSFQGWQIRLSGHCADGQDYRLVKHLITSLAHTDLGWPLWHCPIRVTNTSPSHKIIRTSWGALSTHPKFDCGPKTDPLPVVRTFWLYFVLLLMYNSLPCFSSPSLK